MIGMMMLTFIMFFAFVINTGMLVNAKINLQNAADLAAYSGAATQARQLNAISFLNYEMRRQYKKFIFRYYVLGNLAQDSHRDITSGPRLWYPSRDAKNEDYQVPTVCVIFNASDNFCHINPARGLVSIKLPPKTVNDTINETLRAQLARIESLRRNNCASIGKTNIQLLALWLYNTDPDYEALANVTDPGQRDLLNLIKTAASGLGLLPKEVILSSRIRTLEAMTNEPPEQGLTLERASLMREAADPKKERSINAFFSAYSTLGEHAFPADRIRMDELLPPTGVLKLEQVGAAFDAYAVDFLIKKDGQWYSPDDPAVAVDVNSPSTDDDNCAPRLAHFSIKTPVPLGVKKDPGILTYYAVRLEADAKTMFWPFGGDARLRAYSAAMPFGSRIGPPATEDDFVRRMTLNHKYKPPNVPFPDLAGAVPNLAIQPGENLLTGGWNAAPIINSMYAQLGASGGQTITAADMEQGYQAAMVPNPSEKGVYNILPPNEWPDLMEKYFDSAKQAALYAPVFPLERISSAEDALKDRIDELFPTPPTASQQTLAQLQALKSNLIAGMSRYVEKLKAGAGEDGDGYKVARMNEAFSTRPGAGGQPSRMFTMTPAIQLRDPASVKTSWNQFNDLEASTWGRVGYSVKFVSFESLIRKSVQTTLDGETMNNALPLDPISQGDLQPSYFKH